MKKLMLTAVAIAMAVVANAASIKWNTNYEVGDGTDSGLTSATVAYLIDSAALSQSSIYDALVAGSTLDAAVEGKYVKSATMSDGAVATQTFDAFTAGEKKTLYMVCFDSDLNAVYFSEEIQKSILGTGSANYFFDNNTSIEATMADMSTFDASVGGWVSTAAVPEPTSGLLMLLGMAGLALRRRRA